MQRRKFLRNSSAVVLGIGAFGNISWTGKTYIGDNATTTDILGPFYRPGAPLRKTILPPNFQGKVLNLFGTIFKEDGSTPMSDCLIEIWQCREDGYYDNVSSDYLYRGSQRTTAKGEYHFVTTKPVPEPVPGNVDVFRPAHIHLRVSAIGEQDLITQIYFTDDPYLGSDPSTMSGLSVNRILSVKKKGNHESEIEFNIILKKQSLPDDELIKKVSGIYKMSNDTLMEFYRDGDLLFYKVNSQIWGGLSYAGNSSFVGGVGDTEATFQMLPDDNAKVRFKFIRRRRTDIEGEKIMSY